MSVALKLANRLIDTLPVNAPNLFNPWRSDCRHQADGNGPKAKLLRLAAHLDRQPLLICCGEAPGYQGARFSGVPFTSERLLMEGAIPGMASTGRLSTRRLPYSEPSATIVWRTLYALNLAERVVLWNAVQLHPHQPGDDLSNRTPTRSEVALGAPALKLLTEHFPKARLVAIGQKAAGLLEDLGYPVLGCVRHPSMGGAVQFAEGMATIRDGLSRGKRTKKTQPIKGLSA